MTCPVCNERVDVWGGCFCLPAPVSSTVDELEARGDYETLEDAYRNSGHWAMGQHHLR